MAGEEMFHGEHFPKCIVLQAVYLYLRYSLSYRDIEELMEERGVELDHATVQRSGDMFFVNDDKWRKDNLVEKIKLPLFIQIVGTLD